MTQADEETARRVVEAAYDAMSRQDLDAWLGHATPDLVIRDVPDLPDSRVYRGHEEARGWAKTTLASLPDWNWAVEEFLFNDGSTVLVRVLLTGRSTAGVPVEFTVFHVFEMRGDKFAAVAGFFDEAAASDAAGSPGY
jgi:ketosteroid isomerase-like protein